MEGRTESTKARKHESATSERAALNTEKTAERALLILGQDSESALSTEAMEWGNVAAWAAAFTAFVAVNASTIQWLLRRRDEQHQRDSSRVDELEKQVIELRVNLPLEYVRREDWIRFSGTLDAKLDAMREEMREEIAEVKERLYAGRN